jgi:hypothetical protein
MTYYTNGDTSHESEMATYTYIASGRYKKCHQKLPARSALPPLHIGHDVTFVRTFILSCHQLPRSPSNILITSMHLFYCPALHNINSRIERSCSAPTPRIFTLTFTSGCYALTEASADVLIARVSTPLLLFQYH